MSETTEEEMYLALLRERHPAAFAELVVVIRRLHDEGYSSGEIEAHMQDVFTEINKRKN